MQSQCGTGGSGDYTSESYNYDTTTGNLTSKTGVGSYSYVAQASGCLEGALAARPHAVVTTVGTSTTTYCYDKNGNMTRRDPTGTPVYNFQYNAENQMTGVSGSATASFVYDGDGNRVKSTAGGVTTAHVGAYFEWTGSTTTMKKYYSAGGARVAVRTGASTLNFMLTDHLGSTSVTTDSGGALSTDNRYKAWGESRYSSGTLPTKFTYTGQYSNVAEFGLMFYGARWYDSALSRFTSADSIIPNGVQGLDRYAYANNNAIKYNDPSGHNPTGWQVTMNADQSLAFVGQLDSMAGGYHTRADVVQYGGALLTTLVAGAILLSSGGAATAEAIFIEVGGLTVSGGIALGENATGDLLDSMSKHISDLYSIKEVNGISVSVMLTGGEMSVDICASDGSYCQSSIIEDRSATNDMYNWFEQNYKDPSEIPDQGNDSSKSEKKE